MKSLGCFCAMALSFGGALGAGSAFGEIKLPAVIGDNMVLQQKAVVPIWGWAADGEQVSVEFQGKKRQATGENGRWQVEFKDLNPGGPYEMTIAGKNTITLKNILVGEVWLCSGQSNMEMGLAGCEKGQEEVAHSANPQVRLFQVQRLSSQKPLADLEGASWQECKPQTAAGFSGVGYFFAQALSRARNVPVGVINASFGGSVAVAWVRKATLEADPSLHFWIEDFDKTAKAYDQNKDQLMADYEKAKKEFAKKAQPKTARGKQGRGRAGAQAAAAPRPPRDPRENSGAPGGLYNGMIAPVLPFTVKGILWYQGESDANRHEKYGPIFQALIADWRAAWRQENMPFLFVQLAGFGMSGAGRASSSTGNITASWPYLREVQAKTLAVKNTGMAIAIDVGDSADIHPKRKKPVGERLALVARAVAYGETIVSSGPSFKSMKVKDGKAQIAFSSIGGGLVCQGKTLNGFEICGADQKFVPAKAEIAGKNVVVSSPSVAQPVAVRYAWQGCPECTLYNKEGLPAVPFRTDDFAPPSPGQ